MHGSVVTYDTKQANVGWIYQDPVCCQQSGMQMNRDPNIIIYVNTYIYICPEDAHHGDVYVGFTNIPGRG
jgi:hypothetical protein